MWKENLKEEHEVIEKSIKVLLYSFGIKKILNRNEIFNDYLIFFRDFFVRFVISCHNKKEELIAEKSGFNDIVNEHPELRELAFRMFSDETLIGKFVLIFLDHIYRENDVWLKNVEGTYDYIVDRVEEEVSEKVHKEMVKKVLDYYNNVMVGDDFIVVDVLGVVPYKRHETIFNKFNELLSGSSIVLFNDHEPKSLYYELVAERPDFDVSAYVSFQLSDIIWVSRLRKR
ncbi:MAG: DUF2249 domain-containing protein [Thermoprotei archaeon]